MLTCMPSRSAMIAAGRSAARAMRAPLRAGRALMPRRLSRLVRLWLSMGCPGTRPGNSHRGASGPWWIMSRVGGRSASSPMIAPRRGGRRIGCLPVVRCVVILCHDMFRAEVTDPLGLEPEQENERACRADVDGHSLVVEAALPPRRRGGGTWSAVQAGVRVGFMRPRRRDGRGASSRSAGDRTW
jgi:hypothetical protein